MTIHVYPADNLVSCDNCKYSWKASIVMESAELHNHTTHNDSEPITVIETN